MCLRLTLLSYFLWKISSRRNKRGCRECMGVLKYKKISNSNAEVALHATTALRV